MEWGRDPSAPLRCAQDDMWGEGEGRGMGWGRRGMGPRIREDKRVRNDGGRQCC